MLVNMTSVDITKWAAWGRVVVKSIHGWNANGADLYIQLHQTPPLTGGGSTAGSQLTAGTVPACKSLLAQANNGFMYPLNMELQELLLAISSTEANYTAAGTGIDLTMDIDSQFACDGTENVVGDLTTGQNALQVWAEASGPKRLLRVDVKDNQNTDQLVCIIYAVDTVHVYSLATSFFVAKKNGTATSYYGDAQCGFTPFQQDAFTQFNAAFSNPATPPSTHMGCTLNVTSETNGVWAVGTVYGGTQPNIRAIYK